MTASRPVPGEPSLTSCALLLAPCLFRTTRGRVWAAVASAGALVVLELFRGPRVIYRSRPVGLHYRVPLRGTRAEA